MRSTDSTVIIERVPARKGDTAAMPAVRASDETVVLPKVIVGRASAAAIAASAAPTKPQGQPSKAALHDLPAAPSAGVQRAPASRARVSASAITTVAIAAGAYAGFTLGDVESWMAIGSAGLVLVFGAFVTSDLAIEADRPTRRHLP